MVWLVTGSSGYVSSAFSQTARKSGYQLYGIDRMPGIFTDLVSPIEKLGSEVRRFDQPLVIVHLAAARFDFGYSASQYFQDNVTATSIFLASLDPSDVQFFLHISSVASIDGEKIDYSDHLNCDDAYRSTKFLQEQLIEKWCLKHNIDCAILYPSAIFDNTYRDDTNIGRLQKIASFLPFIPSIEVKKSLTFLPKLVDFMNTVIAQGMTGRYLCIEYPVKSVTEILLHNRAGRFSFVVKIPRLRQLLAVLATTVSQLTGGRFDFWLTPERVEKLFSDTSFESVMGIDTEQYDRTRLT